MATIAAPLDEAVAFLVAEVAGARGLRGARRAATTRSSLSSSFHETIEPILAREGVEVELVANRVDARADGWRVLWRDDAPCPVCGDLCKRRALPAGRPLVYVGDGYSDRCAALAADRVFARARPRRLPRTRNGPLRAVRDVRRRCCCACLSRTTSRSRPSASARSGSTSRTSGTRAGCTASSAAREVRIEAAPGGVDVEPLDAETAAGRREAARRSSSTSTRSRAWAAAQPVLDELVPKLEGFRPPLAPDPVREPRHLDHRAAGLAPRGVRDPHAADRALRRAAARSRTASRRARASSTRARTSSSRSASRGARPSTCSASRAPTSTSTRSPTCPTTRSASGSPRSAGSAPWTAEWFLARHLARPARVARRRPRPAQGGRNLLRSRRARARPPPRSVPEPVGALPSDGPARRPARMNIRRATTGRRGRAARALGGVRARGSRAAGPAPETWEEEWADVRTRHRRAAPSIIAEDDEGAVGHRARVGARSAAARTSRDRLTSARASRRQGVAKALVARASQEVKEQGRDTRQPRRALRRTRRARDVWSRLGFEEVALVMATPLDALERPARRRAGRRRRAPRSTSRATTTRRSSARSRSSCRGSRRPRSRPRRTAGSRIRDALFDDDRDAQCALRARALRPPRRRRRRARARARGASCASASTRRGRMVDEYLSVPTYYGAAAEGRRARAGGEPDARRAPHRRRPRRGAAGRCATAPSPAELPPAEELYEAVARTMGLEP